MVRFWLFKYGFNFSQSALDNWHCKCVPVFQILSKYFLIL